jgi:hypothetical protein
MGWSVHYAWQSKDDVISGITTSCEYFDIVSHSVRGNVVWTLEFNKNKGQHRIGCYLLEYRKEDKCYATKSLTEADGPFFYSCPLKFLKAAPEINPSWRAGVRAFHDSKKKTVVQVY